jgi:hypothetical protein
MDGVLCDYGLPLCSGKITTKKETKMNHIMSDREVQSHTKKLVARLLGQDAAIDDETAGKIKEFLKSKLSAEDHEKMCSMLAGDVEAEDTEPPPDDVELPKNAIERPLKRSAAEDAKADFLRRFPEAARIRIDTSGIQPPARAASYSADGEKSFFELIPQAKRIRLA